MNNKFKIFNIIAISIFALFSILNWFITNGEYSSLENRYLEDVPKLTFSAVVDRSFMEEAENYSNDQLMFRDIFVKMKAFTERLTGKKENNGVYFAKDGYLIEKPANTDDELIEKNLESAKLLGDMGRFDVSFCIIPQAFEIHKDKLPRGTYTDDVYKVLEKAEAFFEGTNVKYADVYDVLMSNNDDEIFYRTDHHQTSFGSYLVYCALGKELGYEPLAVEKFEVKIVAEDFLGTTYSKGLVCLTPDCIEVYESEINKNAEVEFYEEGKENGSVFFPEHLEKKDKYSYFLDGNHGVTVVTGGYANGRKLAMFKDSYSHSLAPFLINHFESIHLIDMRYFGEDPMEYLTENGISEILFLYGTSTFMTDDTIGKIGEYAVNSPYARFGLVKESDKVGNSYFDDAVFLGDSITMGFQAYSGIDNAEFVCGTAMSVGGVFNIDEEGKSFIDRVKEVAPAKIYILLGANELLTAENSEVVMGKYTMVVDRLKKDNPESLIYIQSILPVSAEKESGSYLKNEVIYDYNEKLSLLAEEKQIYYIDVYSAVCDESGYLIGELTWDGVHLDEEGCKRWAEYLKVHAIGGEKSDKEDFESSYFVKGKYDLDDLANKIKKEVSFEGEVGKTSPETLIITHGINEEAVKYAYGFIGGGATSEEIALFEANSEEDAEHIRESLIAYVDKRIKSFESYIPKEVPKLDSAVVYSDKEFVALVVADETNDALDLMKDFTK